ncbi:MAG: carbohydrate binding family 9 domain-containing protein, partial [Acidobacteria bacterium]|nr:carbohydrate binding family 9 domain-containing protein [Acidobacteriota bacterium]
MQTQPRETSEILRLSGHLVLGFGLVSALHASPMREDSEALATGLAHAAYYIEQATSAITVDGVMDEPAWEEATVFRLDYETWPGENIPALVATEARVTYDESTLYVGFHAFDPDPSALRAHLSDRDAAYQDDFLGISIDTFDDQRRAFEFFVNPLGVQMDLFLDGVSGNESDSWDAIWDSAGLVTDDGYVVEMAIPFNQLRFPGGGGEQTWGFDLIRYYPRGDRHRLSVHKLDRDNDCYLCQASKMTGFRGISPGRNVEIVPTLTGSQTEERADFPLGDFDNSDPTGELGLSARWGVTPNLTLNLTINPDFSHVEADVAQLVVNERFALFFPERRPFFLEGADFFSTPLNAVFTRNVGSPDWGLKLTGKQGKNAVGVFVAEDQFTSLLFPGSQGSAATSLDASSQDAVVRYRRDLGEASTLGVLMTYRGGDDYSNSVSGVDGLYRLTDSDSVSFQWLRSSTEYP